MNDHKPLTLLIANDNPSVLEGLIFLFERSADFKIVSKTNSGREVIWNCLTLNPDIVLIDPSLPDVPGIAVMRAVNAVNRHIKFIFLASEPDRQMAQEAMESGATDFIIQGSSGKELLNAVKQTSDRFDR